MSTILSVQDLCTEIKTEYGDFLAVNGVSFDLYKGETLGLVGESGCGKSVTSLSIMGLLQRGKIRIAKGRIMFDGEDLAAVSPMRMRKIRGEGIAMIFQDPMNSLNPVITIGEQMCEMMRLHLKLSKKDALKRAVELLADMGIPRPEVIIKNYPFQLSGGMLQRVMIAMSMSCNPKILLADEPTTALDVTLQSQILDLMNQLKKKYDTSVLLITHNLGVVAETCDRVAVMYAGQIVEMADVKELFDNPRHPYTMGLFKCIPRIKEDDQKLESIPGVVPAITEKIPGCTFGPRCSRRRAECDTAKPPLVEISPGHFCRCVAEVSQ